jgi:hypothetical protein
VRMVLDESGAVLNQIAYDAFGNIVAQLHPTSGVVGSLFDNPILFASREFDAETGLVLQPCPLPRPVHRPLDHPRPARLRRRRREPVPVCGQYADDAGGSFRLHLELGGSWDRGSNRSGGRNRWLPWLQYDHGATDHLGRGSGSRRRGWVQQGRDHRILSQDHQLQQPSRRDRVGSGEGSSQSAVREELGAGQRQGRPCIPI